MIVEAVLAGQSHGCVARQYGISTVWVGKLVARWRAGGWNAVAKQSTRPRSNPNATSEECRNSGASSGNGSRSSRQAVSLS